MEMFSSKSKFKTISLLTGLGLSAILVANNAHANTPKTFTKQEQADLMAKGMWYDERTGLIWDRCYLGETWNGSICTGDHTSYTIDTAKTAMLQHQLGGIKIGEFLQ